MPCPPFLAEKKEVSSPIPSTRTHTCSTSLKTYSESIGYALVEQWTPVDVRAFRTSWGVAANTASKNMTMVKSFFEFCADNEWVKRSPAKKVKALRNKATENAKERIPFSDEELKRMFETCESQYGKRRFAGQGRPITIRPIAKSLTTGTDGLGRN
jgi:site-specific recombinase XerD